MNTTYPLQRILYVEDEVAIQEVVKLALEAVGGFSVEICSSGTAAVERAPFFSPDLILLDVMMPGMDGLSTLQTLRGLPQTSTTPVIFITAKAQSAERAHYLELGAVGVITKPFDPMRLSQNILDIWNRYHDQGAH